MERAFNEGDLEFGLETLNILGKQTSFTLRLNILGNVGNRALSCDVRVIPDEEGLTFLLPVHNLLIRRFYIVNTLDNITITNFLTRTAIAT